VLVCPRGENSGYACDIQSLILCFKVFTVLEERFLSLRKFLGDMPKELEALHVNFASSTAQLLGTNLIHNFTAVTLSVILAVFREIGPFP